jgi:hypothetical protein
MDQQYHHNTKAGATTLAQHEGWSNIIITIMEQLNEVGVTTFCGTLTVPNELPKKHKIP